MGEGKEGFRYYNPMQLSNVSFTTDRTDDDKTWIMDPGITPTPFIYYATSERSMPHCAWPMGRRYRSGLVGSMVFEAVTSSEKTNKIELKEVSARQLDIDVRVGCTGYCIDVSKWENDLQRRGTGGDVRATDWRKWVMDWQIDIGLNGKIVKLN